MATVASKKGNKMATIAKAKGLYVRPADYKKPAKDVSHLKLRGYEQEENAQFTSQRIQAESEDQK